MKNIRRCISVIILVMLLVGIILPTSVSASTQELATWEYLTTGGDGDSGAIYGGNYSAMQFTSGSEAHSVLRIRIPIKRVGSPSTVYCALRTASAGLSTGDDIAYGTLNGNSFSTSYTYQTFTLSADTPISASTQYSIVIYAPSGDDSNYVMWQKDSGGSLENAVGNTSTDGGVTWASATPVDYLFQVWGYKVLEIISAKVFKSYLYDDDWLITAECINNYPPYNTSGNVKDYFQLQLLDDDHSTVLASTSFSAWGDKPQSVYISSTNTSSLTWGDDYYIRITGTYASPPTEDYQLTGTDWKGTNLEYLDDWVIQTAYNMETYYYEKTGVLPEYVAYVTGLGEVLTAEGAAFFTNAIYGLSTERPDIFQYTLTQPIFTEGTDNNTYDTAYTYRQMFGDTIADDMDAIADIFGIDGGEFTTYALLAVAAIIIGAVLLGGGEVVSTFTVVAIVAVPILALGAYFRVIGIQWVVIVSFLSVLLGAWRFFLKST